MNLAHHITAMAGTDTRAVREREKTAVATNAEEKKQEEVMNEAAEEVVRNDGEKSIHKVATYRDVAEKKLNGRKRESGMRLEN